MEKPQQPEPLTGSPTTGEPVFLVVGKIRRPHGLRGEVLMRVITDFPERLQPGSVVYIGEDHRPLSINKCHWHGQALRVAFDSYLNPEAAAELRNQFVFVRAEDRPPLPDGEYYHHQLIGLKAVRETGEYLGEVIQILETGANDVYIVRPVTGKDILLPAIDSVIKKIDLDRSEMCVHIIPGLLP